MKFPWKMLRAFGAPVEKRWAVGYTHTHTYTHTQIHTNTNNLCVYICLHTSDNEEMILRHILEHTSQRFRLNT